MHVSSRFRGCGATRPLFIIGKIMFKAMNFLVSSINRAYTLAVGSGLGLYEGMQVLTNVLHSVDDVIVNSGSLIGILVKTIKVC